MNKIFKYIVFILFVTAFTACEQETLVSPNQYEGISYYPMMVGAYRTYAVEKTTYTILEGADSSTFELKEVISDSIINQNNSITYILDRYVRQDSNDEWTFDSTWHARVEDFKLIVTENDVPYVKLIFPLKYNIMWNGNGSNYMDNDYYEYEDINQPYSIPNFNFDKTVRVIQENIEDFYVTYEYREEVYADSIGLVYRDKTILNYCTDSESENPSENCWGNQIIETGIRYKETLIDYGVE